MANKSEDWRIKFKYGQNVSYTKSLFVIPGYVADMSKGLVRCTTVIILDIMRNISFETKRKLWVLYLRSPEGAHCALAEIFAINFRINVFMRSEYDSRLLRLIKGCAFRYLYERDVTLICMKICMRYICNIHIAFDKILNEMPPGKNVQITFHGNAKYSVGISQPL